ncbi:hypothetical protein [Bacillus sp. PS06]|uniref:hypothetical protein n=1 Tax=Bacillus sp. PS06 TaxID=2764176 RepID=UPI001783187B|nr:hypothetical protein [Bacillus sp. PS06]MBD8067865.1 hypothetical protein [Bacillus sp. PS06]
MSKANDNKLKIIEFKTQKQITDDRRMKRSEKRQELRKRVEAIRNYGMQREKTY